MQKKEISWRLEYKIKKGGAYTSKKLLLRSKGIQSAVREVERRWKEIQVNHSHHLAGYKAVEPYMVLGGGKTYGCSEVATCYFPLY